MELYLVLAGQTKGAVGGKAAAADIQKTLESAVSAGLQDADIGSYLETAVGLLQSIDSSGIKDRSAMLQALSDVTRATKDSPEQIARGLGNIDSAISGSSGEANAFLSTSFRRSRWRNYRWCAICNGRWSSRIRSKTE